MLYKTNKYQTQLTEELLQSIPKDVKADLIEAIENIPFVNWLIQPEEVRGFAKDRPKYCNLSDEDELKTYTDNRIVVDLTRPHILENMDFFRERAIFFDKHKVYTDIHPSPNPKSEYSLFWKEEVRRWKEGLIRESDGEWIPGYYYFYLNYCRILIREEDKPTDSSKKKAKVKGSSRREFPKFWQGDYLWYHYMDQARQLGLHCKLLKRRSVGFSWKFGSMTPCSMYVNPGEPNFHLASDKAYLQGDKGVFGKVVNCLDWIAEHTPMPKLRLIDKPLEKQLGYKDEIGVQKGILSSVFGISLKDDPDKSRGLRAPIIQYEEDGTFPNLEHAWNVNLEAVEEGGVVFGQMCSGGTSGTMGAGFEGSEKLFTSPDAYNIYGLPNVFDKGNHVKSKCGFFWGAYLNRSRNYDKSCGESDVIGALLEVYSERYKIKQSSQDPKALTQKKAEQPVTPQEALVKTEQSIFPTSDIKEYLAEILPSIQQFVKPHYVVDLVITSEGVVDYRPNMDKYPIRDYPLKEDSNKEGAIEIFEMPKRGSDGKTLPLRYIAGIDPVDDDYSSTTSLPSILIFDRLTDRIVAEYTGRPKTAYEFYEICRRLLMFYGATANYENDKKGLFGYFNTHGCLHLLCDTPAFLKQMDYIKGTPYGNKQKGTNSSAQINALGRRLSADLMISPAYGEEETGLLNLHKIRSIGLLKEASLWSIDGNFDRISALGMLMIYREDIAKFEVTKQVTKGSTLANDPFWNKFSKTHGGQGTTILNRLKNNPGFIPQSGFGYNN